MDNVLSILFGAVLAIGSTFTASYLEYLRKKDHFLSGITHEMESYSLFTQELNKGLSTTPPEETDWLGTVAPTIITKINKSRYISDRNTDWFLSVSSAEIRTQIEIFYWKTSEIVSQYIYLNQEKNNLIKLRFDLSNQLFVSGLREPAAIQARLVEIMPIQLGMIQNLDQLLINKLRELINLQDEAKTIKDLLKKEHTWLNQITKGFF